MNIVLVTDIKIKLNTVSDEIFLNQVFARVFKVIRFISNYFELLV